MNELNPYTYCKFQLLLVDYLLQSKILLKEFHTVLLDQYICLLNVIAMHNIQLSVLVWEN